MEILTNEEHARLTELADTYKKAADEKWNAVLSTLNADLRDFLRFYSDNTSIRDKLRAFLKTGKKPSDYFQTAGKWLCGSCILTRHWEAFLYVIDNCTAFTCQIGENRRSYRSESFYLYTEKIVEIAISFTNMNRIDKNLADILEGRLTVDERAYYEKHMGISRYLLACEIDMGNNCVIAFVKNALDSGSDTGVSYGLLAAVFMCKNTGLHELACRLLLAARLQEGLRQAICESADCGRIEPYVMIVETIYGNNLIRFSSIKRAAGAWLGLITEESRNLERISQKSLENIVGCLKSGDYIEDCLGSEDSMKIYIAMWALTCRGLDSALERFFKILS